MSQTYPLLFNDLAPDLELTSADGQVVRLSALWSQQTLLLAFIRHFGCPQCKSMLAKLGEYRAELERAGISLAVVTQGNPEDTKVFCAKYAPGILCLADPQRAAYHAYRLERGSLWQTILSLRVWRANRQVQQAHGWKPELPPPGQDAMQMSGIFIIGTDGRVRLPYYYDDIADHPPLDLLVHGILGKDWSKPFEGPISKVTGQTGE